MVKEGDRPTLRPLCMARATRFYKLRIISSKFQVTERYKRTLAAHDSYPKLLESLAKNPFESSYFNPECLSPRCAELTQDLQRVLGPYNKNSIWDTTWTDRIESPSTTYFAGGNVSGKKKAAASREAAKATLTDDSVTLPLRSLEASQAGTATLTSHRESVPVSGLSLSSDSPGLPGSRAGVEQEDFDDIGETLLGTELLAKLDIEDEKT